jgi:hypothetical protein
MTDQYVIVAPDSTGKKIDTAELTVNAQTVERQRMAIGDNTTAANYLVIDASGNAAIVDRDISATGNITTVNANLTTGAPTANSTVSVTPAGGESSASIQVTGTWTGTLQPQGSVDGTNWVNLGPLCLTNVTTNAPSATIPSAAVGIWQCDIGGFELFRVTASAAMTGTAVVTVQASGGNSMVALDAPVVQHQDVSRTPVSFWLATVTGVITNDAMMSINKTAGGVASGPATNYTVTAGKTMRIQSMTVMGNTQGATVYWVRATLRYTTSGTVTTTSAALIVQQTAAMAAVAGTPVMPISIPIPDGLELPSGASFGVSQQCQAITTQIGISLIGFEY